MAKLTLISFPTCPFVQRSVITLKEKGAAFDVTYVDLQNKPQWFLDISPLGKVPVLKVEREGLPDAIIFESLVILEYLEETAGGPALHPADPVERAQRRSWMEYGNGLQADLHKYNAAVGDEAIEAARSVVMAKFAKLETLVVGPLFAGDKFSCVDSVFAPAFRQLDAMESEVGRTFYPGFPKVEAWRKALASRPSVKEAVPADWRDRYIAMVRKIGSHLLTETV